MLHHLIFGQKLQDNCILSSNNLNNTYLTFSNFCLQLLENSCNVIAALSSHSPNEKNATLKRSEVKSQIILILS